MPGMNGIFGVIAAVLAVIAALLTTQGTPQLPDDDNQVIVSPTSAPAPTTAAPLPSEPTADPTEVVPPPTATTAPLVPTVPVAPTAPTVPGPSVTPTAPPADEPEDAAPVAPAPGTPAAPATPDPGQTVPVGNTEVFVADYDTGDLSQWDACQAMGEHSDGCAAHPNIEVVNDGPGHETAAHFTLGTGQAERSEVLSGTGGASNGEGDERWYEWSMKVNEGFTEPEGWGLILMQWHQSAPTGSPLLTIMAEGGNVNIGGEGQPTLPLGPLPEGEWKNYVLHVKFSSDSSSGFVEGWENGVQTVQKTPYASMSDSENYLKQGIYHDESANTATHQVWHDGLRVTAP